MLIKALRDAAVRVPDAGLVSRGRTVSYGDVALLAERAAHGLLTSGVQRFGIATEDPHEIVPLLAAAAAAGAEACVYPRSLSPEQIAGFAQRLGHRLVVTPVPAIEGIRTVAFPDLLGDPGPLGPQEAAAVLILTTGTSGTPKGVRHDWSRLLGAVRRDPAQEGTRWLLAYNLNQFAGYQVLLHALVHAATIVVPQTSQARDALAALRAEGVTHASATPTFWRLLVGDQDPVSTADLRLQQITMGGEAAPASLITKLRTLFPDARITHIYAGTEFGSAVAVTDGLSGLPASVLDRDEDADVRFRIHDGELLVRSRHAMLGYHGEEAAVEWHATGDLVEQRDGRLHFVGRTVEIINVGGAKVHPLPIEEIVQSVPGVLVASVYGAPNAITGHIVAVDVVPSPDVDPEQLKAAIHAACRELPGPGRPRRLRMVDEIATTGQKILRRQPEVES